MLTAADVRELIACPEAPPLLVADLAASERLAAPISAEAVRSVISFWSWSDGPGFHWMELAWDTRRIFGADAGLALFREIADLDPPARREFIDETWSDADRPHLTQFDRLWIDALAGARGEGWNTPNDLERFFVAVEVPWYAADIERLEQRREFNASMGEVVAEHSAKDITAMPKLILSDAEFVANFVAPSYLLDGILQRQFCYALTAATGAGKTAIALRLAAHVGLGRNLGDREVEQGSVLYFASENAVDVQARWIAMAQHCGFEIGSTNVHFVSGATRLSEIAERITTEATAGGHDLALVVVDTSAATFEGDDENSNVHAIEHAKRMRSLTLLRGGPTVLVLTHPTKRATADDLIPRGGGAFLAEIDGNLCARKSDSAVEVHWAGKFRGMDFAPMMFQLSTVTAARLKDRRGRNIPTVIAAPLDEAGRQAMAAAGRRDEDVVLRAVESHPGVSSNDMAKAIGWTLRDGRPYGVKVRRTLDKLAEAGLVHKHRDTWALTAKGEKELNALDGGGTKDRNTIVSPMPILPPRNTH